ncbi:MAG: fructose-6-phosphate aldolase [Candidatus Latescibacterota bacterium]|nr:MAG: fructose-6-phosphate aldolase [Candidatus Latescibacterota bacterium]
MKFFLDTAKVDEIRKAVEWGIVDGVTTNPTHIADTGRPFLEVVREICSIVDGPISVEVISTEAEGMVREARDLASIHPNIVVKVPLIEEGIKAIKELSRMGIRTNATLNFSPAQALLAAKVGATYVSPFVGRLDAVGHIGMELVRQIKRIYDNYGFKTQIIVSAVRHPVHVLEAALAGADVVTMRYEIMKALFDHPLTDVGLETFLEDWKRVPK